jgi:hypothetical protein
MQQQKEDDEKKKQGNSMFSDFREFDAANKNKEPISVYNKFGDIRQCNEGKYEFLFSDSPDKVNLIL